MLGNTTNTTLADRTTLSHYSRDTTQSKVYRTLKVDFPTMGKQVTISIGVHAIKRTMGPDGLITWLLHFGAAPLLPVLTLNALDQTQTQNEMKISTAQKSFNTLMKNRKSMQPVPKYAFGKSESGGNTQRDMKEYSPYVVTNAGRQRACTTERALFFCCRNCESAIFVLFTVYNIHL